MDITPLVPKGKQVINAYGDGGFRVSGIRYEGPLIVSSQQCFPWIVKEPAAIEMEDFQAILALPKGEIELVLFGSGAKIAPVSSALKADLRHDAIAIEVMDTGAACRTYNVLLAEGRLVCAALFPI